jgi:hypothetical protein
MNRYVCLTICLFALLISCATKQVSYRNDIAPILQSRCALCHRAPEGSAYQGIGLALDNYDALMQGTIYGPIITVGDSRRSILNMLVEGRAARQQCMLHQNGGALNEREITLLRDWVNQGAQDN